MCVCGGGGESDLVLGGTDTLNWFFMKGAGFPSLLVFFLYLSLRVFQKPKPKYNARAINRLLTFFYALITLQGNLCPPPPPTFSP